MDRGIIYGKYLGGEKPRRFVIRLEERDLIHRGERKNCGDLAKVLPTPYKTVLIGYEDGKEKKRTVQYNALPVKPPRYGHQLYLVVVKEFELKPMMILNELFRRVPPEGECLEDGGVLFGSLAV